MNPLKKTPGPKRNQNANNDVSITLAGLHDDNSTTRAASGAPSTTRAASGASSSSSTRPARMSDFVGGRPIPLFPGDRRAGQNQEFYDYDEWIARNAQKRSNKLRKKKASEVALKEQESASRALFEAVGNTPIEEIRFPIQELLAEFANADLSGKKNLPK